jgi:hypothetical protein
VLLAGAAAAVPDEALPAGGRADEVAERRCAPCASRRPAIPGVRGAVDGVVDAEAIDRMRLAPSARAAPPRASAPGSVCFRLRADGTPERAAVEYLASGRGANGPLPPALELRRRARARGREPRRAARHAAA